MPDFDIKHDCRFESQCLSTSWLAVMKCPTNGDLFTIPQADRHKIVQAHIVGRREGLAHDLAFGGGEKRRLCSSAISYSAISTV